MVGSAPLLERERELAAVEQAIARATAGEGGVLVVEGPAGIGKTSLLDVAIERAGEAGMAVHSARGSVLEHDFGFGVTRSLFESTVAGASSEARRHLLAGSAALASPVVAPAAVPDPEMPIQQAGVIHGLYWLTANLAERCSLLFVVDDLQWSDPPSVHFLAYLAHRVEDLPVLVIGGVRTGDPQVDPSIVSELMACPGVEALRPGPLSVGAVGRIVRDRLGGDADDVFVAACHRASGGVPFLVQELTAAVDADHVPPTARSAPDVEGMGPRTVARATTLRMSRLSAPAIAVARAIAVLGPHARLDRLSSLSGVDEDGARAALDALTAMEILAAGPPVAFAHPLVHRAIYDDIPAAERAEAHRRSAALLAEERAPLDEVAAHLLRTEPAGLQEVAATLRAGAHEARARGATESVVVYLRRALAEGAPGVDRAVLLHELGAAEAVLGDPAALEDLDAARARLEDPVTRSRIGLELAEQAILAGQWSRGFAVLGDALTELGDRDPDLAARLEAIRCAQEFYDPRFAADFDRRLPHLRALADRGGIGARALAIMLAAAGAARGGHRDEVLALVERGVDGGWLLRDEGPESLFLAQSVGALSWLDALDVLDAVTDGVLDEARRQGSTVGFGYGSLYRGFLDARRGRLAEAEAHLRSAIELSLEHRFTFLLPWAFWFAADVFIERMDVDDLAGLVDSIELEPAMASTQNGALVAVVRGRLRLARGDRRRAIADLRAAGEIFSAIRFRNPIAALWRSPLALALGRDGAEEARALVAAELEDATDIGLPRSRGIALRAAGLLEGGDRGIELLRASLAVLEHDDHRLERTRTLVELGAALRRRDQRVAAREPLSAGLDLARRCGAQRLAERALEELRTTGARPRRAAVSGPESLTPSETRVARMAGQGMSNRDIAETLFVSSKTVENHLGSVYRKLAVNSRNQLGAALEPDKTP